MRFRLECAYRGTFFRGWAKQPGLRTVQGTLEEALALVLREPVELTVAGRTDAGVHASAQTAHFDVCADRLMQVTKQAEVVHACEALTRRLNRLIRRADSNASGLPDVVVYSIEPVADVFDARFAALRRHYVYRVADVAGRNPLYAESVWWVEEPLQIHLMREAARALVGEHDFLSFCKPREGASTIRTLEAVDLVETDTGLEVRLSADAFCHSMVRSIVGALVEVGRGRKLVTWIADLVAFPSREQAAPLAPPHGLTLRAVDYPPAEQWAAQQQQTRRLRSVADFSEGGLVDLAADSGCCGE